VDALYSPYAPRSYGYSDADGRPTAFELERRIRALEGAYMLYPIDADGGTVAMPRAIHAYNVL